MPYLMIENRVNVMPSVEAIRMLGVSFSRGAESRIGQFGSGFPNALAVLARYGLLSTLKMCLGKEVYTFSTVEHLMTDANGNQETKHEIRMKKQNGGSWDLNISTEFGELDWTDVTMAIREFVSNALDGADQYDGTYSSFKIGKVDGEDSNSRLLRAKDGYIRVYVYMNDDIEEYIKNINKNFICLKPDYNSAQRIYSNTDGGSARIYRKGVLVGTFGDETSLFHYNIPDLDLKESRIVDSSEAISKCARELSCASIDHLNTFIDTMKDESINDRYWERQFSTWELNPIRNYSLPENKKTEAKKRWKVAIDRSLGKTVVVENSITKRMIEGKGLIAYMPESSAFAGLLINLGAKKSDEVLNQHEIEGKELIPATTQATKALNKVWSIIEKMNMTIGKQKPKVMCFHQNIITEGSKAGYFVMGGNTIYIRSDFADNEGMFLISTVLEEVAHYLTGAADNTRDFQEFAFKLAASSIMLL